MEFSWPWQYNFPPFFTLQPNAETEAKRLVAWQDLTLEYCRFHKIHTLDVQESLTSPLFLNKSINRQLSLEGAVKIFDSLKEEKRLEWCDKLKKRCMVYWRTPEEWGNQIYKYVLDKGMTNSVFTIYELTNGDDFQDFSGMDLPVLLKALETLEVAGKAEVMCDGEGVKFF